MFNGIFDIILFAAFAIFIGIRLYNVLGRKDFDHGLDEKENVVPFPGGEQDKTIDVNFEEIKDDYKELEKKHGLKIVNKIKEIRKYDPSFAEKTFLGGAKRAFEVILGAFTKGDKKTLKPLLSKEIYKGFTEEIDKREKSGKIEEATLVSILTSNIKDVALNKKYAKIAVEIVSEQINIIKNKKGEIIEGDPSHVDKVSEIWTFARNLGSSNPNWELVETKVASS